MRRQWIQGTLCDEHGDPVDLDQEHAARMARHEGPQVLPLLRPRRPPATEAPDGEAPA